MPSDFLSFEITPFTQSGCVLFGTYDFFFTGFDATGPMTTAGSFGVDASGKLSGEIDFKNHTEARAAQLITGGTCTNGTIPNTGKLAITTASGTSTYTFASQGINPTDRGRMAESGDANGVSGTGRFVFIHPGVLAGATCWPWSVPIWAENGWVFWAVLLKAPAARSATGWAISTMRARSPLRRR